jgi:hypothetical protein
MKLQLGLSLTLMALCACAPKVYVVDRQTILEEDAAGEWPQFEKELLKKSKSAGPVPFSHVPLNASRARLYNVLNSELVSTTSSDAATPTEKPSAKK